MSRDRKALCGKGIYSAVIYTACVGILCRRKIQVNALSRLMVDRPRNSPSNPVAVFTLELKEDSEGSTKLGARKVSATHAWMNLVGLS